MSTVFVSEDLWPQLTRAIRRSRHRCLVAVAYLGAGASRMLPLRKGSRLVVDASERAVSTGQTCPADLQTLLKRGVAIYSVPNLHAKVFVVGKAAYVGSNNVSGRSAGHLIEAVIRTTDSNAVRAARGFVEQNCLYELTPTVLRRLAKLYRPPQIPGGKPGRRPKAETSRSPMLPRLLLAQLKLVDWSDRDQALHDSALVEAKKRRQHSRGFELESFRHAGLCPYQIKDVVIQVTDEGNNKVLVTPPGNVRYVRTRDDGRKVSFVYLERPARRRRHVRKLARVLGRGSLRRLRRNGLVRDASFARNLLGALAG